MNGRRSTRCGIGFLLTIATALLGVSAAGPSLAAESSPEAVRAYRLAQGFQQRGLYPQALERWQSFLGDHPGDPLAAGAKFNLGVTQFRSEKLPEAAATFREVLAKYPQFEERDAARFNLGLVQYNTAVASQKPEDYRAAAAEFAQVGAKGKQAADAAFYRADCLYAAGDSDAAVGVYRELIAKHREARVLPDALEALGTLEQERREFERAVATFEDLSKRFPDSPLANDCRLRQAMCRIELEKFDEAERSLDQLSRIADFPHADYALLQQARCRFEKGDFGRAADLYESLPRRFGESTYKPAALVSAGHARFRAKQYPQARGVLENALRDSPEAPEIVEGTYWLAQAYLETKEPGKVAAIVDRALPKATDDDWRTRLAFVRIEARAADERTRAAASDEFDTFAKSHEKHLLAPRALYNAAAGALGAGDFDRARERTDRFAQSYSDHELAGDVLFVAGESRLLGEKPDFAGAEGRYRELIAKHAENPQRPAAELRLAVCQFEQARGDEALKTLASVLPRLKEKSLVAEARLLEGRVHAAADRPKQAVDALQAARAADSRWDRDDEVLFALATNLRAAGDAGRAESEFGQVVNRHAKSLLRPRALLAIGELQSAKGAHDAAAGTFERLVREHAKSDLVPLARYGAAAAYYSKKDDNRAIAELDRLLADHGTSTIAAEARFLRGRARHRTGRDAEAAADLEAVLAANPPAERAAEAREMLARVQSKLKQHERAIATLTKLLADRPEHPRADRLRYDLAFARADAGQADEAVRTFRELAEKHPESPLAAESLFRVGEQLERQDKADEAAKAYATALGKAKRADLRERLLYKSAFLEFSREQFAKAIPQLETLIAEHDDGTLAAEAPFLLGECLYGEKKYEAALPWYVRAADGKAERHRATALYRAGDCAAALEHWGESRKHYEQLVGRFPQFERIDEARYGIGLAYQKEGNIAAARPVYEALVKGPRSETAAKACFMLGECAFAEKRYEAAVEHFLETALGYEHPEWRVLGHLEAGRCFVQMNQPGRARAEFETIVEKFPEHARAKDARALLKGLDGK